MSFTRHGKLRRRYKCIILVLSLYVMIIAGLYFFQNQLIFRPTVLDKEYEYEFNSQFEEVFLEPVDGVRLNAVHFKTSRPNGVIFYLHGNMGDLSRWGTIAERLTEYNYDVFVLDYRTYGKSTGKLSEQGLYQDAQFAYDYLKKEFTEDQIVLYGRSLGTGIASYIASKNNPSDLILETPYYSLMDIASQRFPIVPVKMLLKYKIPTYLFLENTNCPIHMIHGTADNVIPLSSAKKLEQHINNSNVSLRVIKDGHHNDLGEFPEYESWLAEILN